MTKTQMDISLVKEIIACLPDDRTLYTYYKDAYAVDIFRRYLEERGTVKLSELRSSRYGKLLDKSIFTNLLASLGKGNISADHLNAIAPEGSEHYVLTLGIWGDNKSYGWEQVSRPGANLVLQLNFGNKHDQMYRELVMDDFDEFQYGCHPVSTRRCTMAWARLDLDFENNEALIEEIQTDWLRAIKWLENAYLRATRKGEISFDYEGRKLYSDKVACYLRMAKKHQKIWHEAMLNAAINFIIDELGIKYIFYHSFDTGALLKHLNFSKPPKSLYTDLPRRFCFDKVNRGPSFIAANKKARRRLKAAKNEQWFTMSA